MKLDGGTSRTAIAVPQLHAEAGDRTYRCIDGVLSSADVAKVAGVSRKAARRAVETFCNEHEDSRSDPDGATMTFDPGTTPDPTTQTRAQMARIVAERIGLGRFGVKKRIAERAARPPAKPKERRMSSTQHPWRIEKHGRAMKALEGGVILATLTCSKCPKTETIRFRQLCDAADMDRKFSQQGWAVDPAKCPDHNRRNHQPRKDTAMATTPAFTAPSPAAIAAQAKMFGLLQTHFDPDAGVYGSGYSDGQIASECRLSVELVAGVRKQAFGDLKVPAEVGQLQADISALESLLEETIEPIRSELRALRQRVTECCKRFGG